MLGTTCVRLSLTLALTRGVLWLQGRARRAGRGRGAGEDHRLIAVMLGREGTLVDMQAPERGRTRSLLRTRRGGYERACSSTNPTT
jgi:hypothetical protein